MFAFGYMNIYIIMYTNLGDVLGEIFSALWYTLCRKLEFTGVYENVPTGERYYPLAGLAELPGYYNFLNKIPGPLFTIVVIYRI